MNTKKAGAILLAISSAVLAVRANADVVTSGKNVTVSGDVSYSPDQDGLRIEVLAGSTLRLGASSRDVVVHSSGGTVVLNAPMTNWQSKVGLWLDASATETLQQFGSSTVSEGGKSCKVIERWFDRRADHRTWRGYNNRGVATTMPYLVTDGGPNGLPYLTFGDSATYGRRLPLVTVDETGAEVSGSSGGLPPAGMTVKLVMMVFGSQRGGGQSLLSSTVNTRYGRVVGTDKSTDHVYSDPIFGVDTWKTWVDGALVDAMTTGLNGKWQVVAMEVKDIAGFGWAHWDTAIYGGQNYAEILVFTEDVTDDERNEAAQYLAGKWGVSTYVPVSGAAVRLFGSGAASVQRGTVNMGGRFSGTLDVPSGAAVNIVDASLIPTSPAPGSVAWYDPSRTDLYRNPRENGTFDGLYDVAIPYQAGGLDIWCGSQRSPLSVLGARAWGEELRWLDYRTSISPEDTIHGKTIRFSKTNTTTVSPVDARTGFMVLDTTDSVGTPFIDVDVYARDIIQVRTTRSAIFRVHDGVGAFVLNSPTYLDGRAVNAGKDYYTQRPELLSFVLTESLPIACFGYYNDLDDDVALKHGELLLYADALSDADRVRTEAYLMNKWLGFTPHGYGDESALELTGAGDVTLAGPAVAPVGGEGFSGSVTGTGGLSCAIAGSTVTRSFDFGGGAFDPGADEVVVSVELTGNVPAGRYRLLKCGSLSREVTWTCEAKGAVGRRTLSLAYEDGELWLTVERPGLTILLK